MRCSDVLRFNPHVHKVKINKLKTKDVHPHICVLKRFIYIQPSTFGWLFEGFNNNEKNSTKSNKMWHHSRELMTND